MSSSTFYSFNKIKTIGISIYLTYNINVDGRLIEDDEKGRTAILPFSHLETMNVYIEII